MGLVDFDGSAGREDGIGHRVEYFRVEGFRQNLTVVHNRRRWRVDRDLADPVQHAPLGVKKAMALAKADSLLIDGTGAGDHVVKPGQLGTDIGQCHGRAVALHAVQRGCIQVAVLGNLGRVQQPEAALDRVGGQQHQFAV